MRRFTSPFAGGNSDAVFDADDEFAPEHLPEPGPFLEGHDVLTGDRHVAVHEMTGAVFEDRTVYDATFGYNLARLNLDTRHPESGYRYAEEADDPAVLRAEFTPTTPFCPSTRALTVGSVRALNDCDEHHDYDLVRVRVAEMHDRSDVVNERLAELETDFLEVADETAVRRSAKSDESTENSSGPV